MRAALELRAEQPLTTAALRDKVLRPLVNLLRGREDGSRRPQLMRALGALGREALYEEASCRSLVVVIPSPKFLSPIPTALRARAGARFRPRGDVS